MPDLELTLRLNGDAFPLRVDALTTLAEAIREHAGMTGTKIACGEGTCGACTVLVDGTPALSCIMLAGQAEGREVQTVESHAPEGELSPLQQAFIAEDAFQCGFCTPGQLASASALLERNSSPSRAEIRHAMAGNLCRCGAYVKIERAILRAAGAGAA
jgi:xanthine dehydrogenase YagT iron-sulfur-binding subunit